MTTQSVQRFLVIYSAVATLAFVITAYFAIRVVGVHRSGTAEFDRIRAHRIDLVEPDGTARLILSNRSDYPGSFFHGKEVARPDRTDSAGLLMIDDQGTEDGGLIFSGRLIDGKPVTSGHLSFDQYDQDQTVSLSRSEENGQTVSDLVLSDQPTWPLNPETIQEFMRVKQMADGPAKQAAWAALRHKYPPSHARATLRRAEDGSAGLTLSDAAGLARLRLRVEADGRAAIEFLDSQGRVSRSFTPGSR